jgi:hypothetical protein
MFALTPPLCCACLAWPPAPGRARQEERIGTLPLARAAACFAEFDEACAREDGRLWGVEVCGPVLLVDPATRKVAGNRPDEQDQLVEREGVFVGTLPSDRPVANAPLDWAGVHWAMVMAPFLGETRAERVGVLAHESFHRLQPELGLFVLNEENVHLDAPEGRLWMQLEWNALEIALSTAGEARLLAVQDALAFRAARRARFPEAGARENPLEIREGLANYTGLCIAGLTGGEVVAYVANRRRTEDGFVRSFAYNNGPLYGYLLDACLDTWRKDVRGTSDLGALLAAALNLAPDAARAAERSALYGGTALRTAEEERERARQARLEAYCAALVDGPVLVLDLALVTSGTLDTRKLQPFDEGRTVYTERKLIAKWGTLQVSGSAILEDSTTRRGRVSLHAAAADHLSGEGWKLDLAPGWTIAPGERAGDFVVRRNP